MYPRSGYFLVINNSKIPQLSLSYFLVPKIILFFSIFTVEPFDGLGSSFEHESIDFPFYVSLLANRLVSVILVMEL